MAVIQRDYHTSGPKAEFNRPEGMSGRQWKKYYKNLRYERKEQLKNERDISHSDLVDVATTSSSTV